MVFSSSIFLFLFLPLFLAAYYLTPVRYRNYVILIGSYAFYGWWRVDFMFLFMGVTFWTYFWGVRVATGSTPQMAYRACTIGVVGDLAVLGYFKYFNFGVDSLNSIVGVAGGEAFTFWHVLLPIGISFYIFQGVSYLIDVYRKDAPPAERFIDFAAFLSLFPQLIAGPVLRYKDLTDQMKSRTHTLAKFSEGSQRFMIGFCKKVLIADSVAPIVDTMFAHPDPSFAGAWLGALAYTIQLYFDFSGYSDMAIGLGLMMGFRFCENFKHPYISASITEFWRRWHISLSMWLRDYLYISLGGNRFGTARTYFNLMATMVLGGLWHGSNWTFVLWGFWHGGLLAGERALGVRGDRDILPRWIGLPLTLFFVIIGWIMFRATTVGSAFSFYAGMFGFNGMSLSDEVSWQISGLSLFMLAAGFVIVFVAPFMPRRAWATTPNWMPVSTGMAASTALSVFGAIAILKLVADSYSPFLYFQF